MYVPITVCFVRYNNDTLQYADLIFKRISNSYKESFRFNYKLHIQNKYSLLTKEDKHTILID